MFSVSPEIYSALSLGSRYLFVFFALMILLFAFSWLHIEHKKHRERVRSLPEMGTIGEMIVISGSEDLPEDTWFPVPREGILGSVRSCDLVIPCSGVHSRHLDFFWQDGIGLLLRPRNGCQAFVNGMVLDRKMDPSVLPLVHGSFLQVGSAVLRLQLFSALNHTNACSVAPEQFSVPSFTADGPTQAFPAAAPVRDLFPSLYAPPVSPAVSAPVEPEPDPMLPGDHPAEAPSSRTPTGNQSVQSPSAVRRKRADRWKEDWSE